MNTEKPFLFTHFLEYVLLFLYHNVAKECEWSQKFNLRVLLSVACIEKYCLETKIIWGYTFL